MYFLTPIVLVALVGWGLRAENDFFLVSDSQVEVEIPEDHQALLKYWQPKIDQQLQALKGVNIWKLDLQKVHQEMLDIPWVKSVHLSRRFPDQLSFQVQWEEVALLYVDNNNHIFPVARDGRKLPQTEAVVAPPRPILRNSKIYEDKRALNKLLQAYSKVPNSQSLRMENIAQVDWDKVTGLTLDLIDERAKVHLGTQDIQTKGLQVLRVTEYLKSQKHKARVIDASFSKKVLVRPRKHP